MARWQPFPHDASAYDRAPAALKRLWPRLHAGDAEPLPEDAAVLAAWRAFHAGQFERAVDANKNYYQAWYNLGMVRAGHGDELGAGRAFRRTVDVKPGHAQALFQLGLVEEKNHHIDRAVHYYAKAFTINPALMRVDANPRILDSKLTHVALLQMYKTEHSRRSMQLQGTAIYATPAAATPPPAPSPTRPVPS